MFIAVIFIHGIIFFTIGLVGFGISFDVRHKRFSNEKIFAFEQPITLRLRQDVTLDELEDSLKAVDIPYDASVFRWSSRMLGYRRFLSGNYVFSGNYSYEDFFSKLAFGQETPIKVTVLPGQWPNVLMKKLGENFLIGPAAFESLMSDSLFWSQHGTSFEISFGKIIPDTYKLYWTWSAKKVMNYFFQVFKKKVEDRYEDRRKELNISWDDIIILASIVEWEAKKEEEKERIAGVYWNRIHKNMYLQADPTVIFAIKEARRLRHYDYNVSHPYNTYKHKNLPPGALNNPSLSSIKAVLYPEDHNFLFMVASPEGGHIFNEDYAKHLEVSKIWQNWIRKQYWLKRQKKKQY